ncbi:unnamed protein product [Durusdinium trenchii]|uniref:Uncharacterized protein n=2 Tax=Durusdinium trenchii TaxID=1381693 RepID=A0ABP0JDS8_9DINO
MAFERLKALDPYLEQLKGADNFSGIVEEQCVSLVKEIRSMDKIDISSATPLLALIQQCPHWTKAHRESLLQVIQAKVEKSVGSRVVKGRFPLQDYTMFPLYLAERDWTVILGTANFAHKCTVIMERLHKLGLRHPSEPTYAMLTASLLLSEPERLSDHTQLRTSADQLPICERIGQILLEEQRGRGM